MLASAEQAPAAQPRAAAPERGTCAYTACYCEENALLLSKRLAGGCAAAAEHLYVVFVTNRLRQAPLWCQRAGRDEDGLVVWDYHVRPCAGMGPDACVCLLVRAFMRGVRARKCVGMCVWMCVCTCVRTHTPSVWRQPKCILLLLRSSGPPCPSRTPGVCD